MSIITDIADAVAAELTAGSFSQPVAAERRNLPQFELADMKSLKVTVVPKGVVILPGGRTHGHYDYTIDVAVQKKVDQEEGTEVDELLGLVDEIADHLRFKRLTGFPGAVWLKTEHPAIYSQEHLHEMRQFTSLLTLTFRVAR